ncbi:MAG TPA: DUF11 domain-containing protein, partial [Chloroflexi bacterium]|nr:DUF11 domain-containing protein [Chloroflexota bacterium]
MKRYVSLGLALCLGCTILALTTALIMTMNVEPGRASSPQKPAAPDLIISVEAAEETVLADSNIIYTVFYTNNSSISLSDVVVFGTLARKQHYTPVVYLSDPAIPTTSFTYTGHFEDGFGLSWDLGELAHGSGGWIQVTTTVPPEAEPPWADRNRWPLLGMSAAITTSSGVSVGNPEGEDADTASVMVVGPILRISKEDDPDEVRPGRLLTYTLTLENKDREDAIAATNVVITDAVPGQTTFYDASPSGYYSPTSPNSGLVIWNPPNPLEPGQTLQVSFTVRLTESMSSCPVGRVNNLKADYQVSSDETIATVNGNNDRRTPIDDVLEKRIETPSPPPGDRDVFPGGIVTYTINVYNPLHDRALTGLRLTDTLPGEPTPFVYLGMLEGPEPISVSRQIVWDGLEIAAGDVATLSFRAQVPPHINMLVNKPNKKYPNNLSASAPGVNICPMKDIGPSEANVRTQIWMEKSVDPSLVLSGEWVTYTITLENFGDTPVHNVRLTDTLPNAGGADFSYVSMVSGPQPEPGYRDNPVVWDGLSVPAYGQISLSFIARAVGYPLTTYGNALFAGAPSTSVPDRTNQAKVTIDSPFRIQKVAIPDQRFVGQSFAYSVTICNVATGTYTLDKFRDDLAEGFLSGGVRNYVYAIPNVDLAAGECWDHDFHVDVTMDVGCSTLPRTIKNTKGSVQFDVVAPVEQTYESTADLAPLRVNPHVRIEKGVDHKTAMPGESVVYTITLINDSTINVTGIVIEDTLPGYEGVYFQYQEMVSGPEPDSTGDPDAGGPVRWVGQSVPANGQLVLAFRAQIPVGIARDRTYKNNVLATTSQLICIESIDPAAPVRVVNEVVELSKVVNPTEAAPFSTVRYEIRLKNLDSQPITGVVVTETLPKASTAPHFTFLQMAAG